MQLSTYVNRVQYAVILTFHKPFKYIVFSTSKVINQAFGATKQSINQ